jgi:Flp pilus assembly pilin Flp
MLNDVQENIEERGRMMALLNAFHEDEDAVAMTEYIIVFSLISIGATISLISVAYYVKAYRDFMVWWLSHPAV